MNSMAKNQSVKDAQQSDLHSALFPLSLTAFERYMQADDHPGYPMTFVIRIDLTGEFKESEFRTAHQFAVGRHPLLSSRIGYFQKQKCWLHSDYPITINGLDTAPCEVTNEWKQIDLTKERGLKTNVVVDQDQIQVSFVFHHAATDGIGALRFIGDVLGRYGQLTAKSGEDVPELMPITGESLIFRGQLWDPESKPSGSLWRTLYHLYDFARCFPIGFKKSDLSMDRNRNRSPFVSRTIDRKSLTQIKKTSRSFSVNPNDLYMANLFATCQEWSRQTGTLKSRDRFRILIPISLRLPKHDQLPAANVLSYVFIHRASYEISMAQKNITSISQTMYDLMGTIDSRLFARLIQLAASVPGMLPMFVNSPFRICTAILSNVGDVKRQLNCRFPIRKGKCVAGSLVLDGLYGAAPIRKGTAVSMSLGTYAGGLLINFNFDPSQFTEEQSHQFADMYLQQLSALQAETVQSLTKAA